MTDHVFTVTATDDTDLDGADWRVVCSCGGMKGVVVGDGLDTFLRAHVSGAIYQRKNQP